MGKSLNRQWRQLCGVALMMVFAQCSKRSGDESAIAVDSASWPISFGYGRAARQSEIDSLDIDVRPDGQGLPHGSGSVSQGRRLYLTKCAQCHGPQGTEGPYNKLVSKLDAPDSVRRGEKAIGNYWPYATTLYDYINRAMPYNTPGTLTADEVYSLTAFLLYRNNLVDSTIVINAVSLPKVIMPAQKLFIDDDRRGGNEIR